MWPQCGSSCHTSAEGHIGIATRCPPCALKFGLPETGRISLSASKGHFLWSRGSDRAQSAKCVPGTKKRRVNGFVFIVRSTRFEPCDEYTVNKRDGWRVTKGARTDFAVTSPQRAARLFL